MIEVSNTFTEPDEFELSTNICLEEKQNIRITIQLIDYIANLIQDNSMARTSIKAYLDYGNNVFSSESNLVCSNDCLKGIFVGNLGTF